MRFRLTSAALSSFLPAELVWSVEAKFATGHSRRVEAWFAGVHSDVGGNYAESESQLSKIALQWMLCEAEFAGLSVDPQRKADILGGKPPYVAPDAITKN